MEVLGKIPHWNLGRSDLRIDRSEEWQGRGERWRIDVDLPGGGKREGRTGGENGMKEGGRGEVR